LDERFDAWFAQLNERQRQVLQWRYGLVDGQELTLEEIGERLSLSRERIRQIATKALRRLQHPVRERPVYAISAHLHHIVVGAGGMMSEVGLCGALADFVRISELNLQGAVRLLLDVNEKLSKVKEMQAWCLTELRTFIPLVGLEAINILTLALAPIFPDELLGRFKQSQLYNEHRDKLNDQFILACIRANDKIAKRDDGSLGLESWDRHWQDDIVLALRRLGQPTHYTAIADAINASQQNGQHVTARAVHIRLMQHPDIFVWIGRKGTYGLKEWGIERAASYVNALTQILQDAGHPLTITEILAALVKLRPYYDEVSVQVTLGTNCRFHAFPNNTFGLAEWREENFASEHYRLQRLFENAEKVMASKTKQEVEESLTTVDDFIAQIRGNHDG
jgi:DNA-binding CsgD family transcriptional regulator